MDISNRSFFSNIPETEIKTESQTAKKINQTQTISRQKIETLADVSQNHPLLLDSSIGDVKTAQKELTQRSKNNPQTQVNFNQKNVIQTLHTQRADAFSSAFQQKIEHFEKELTSLKNDSYAASIAKDLEVLKKLDSQSDPDQIIHLTSIIEQKFSIAKTDQTSQSLWKTIGKGKAKQVWSKTADPDFAYFTPVKGIAESIFGRKKSEIQEEVRLANTIKTELYQKNLDLIFKDLENSASSKKLLIRDLMETYPTPEKLLKALSQQNPKMLAHTLKIDPLTAKSILTLFKNPQSAAVKLLTNSGTHLAIHMKEVKDDLIDGQYTVRTQKAAGDLEKIMTSNVSFQDRLKIGLDFFSGLSDLHQAGYAHGDLKPDNILIYKKEDAPLEARLSDFGKTKPIQDEESVMHTGNTRYAPPEGKLSKKGEVYSSALVLIRLMEEQVLGKRSTLIKPSQLSSNADQILDNRRGIERFLMTNDSFPHTETSGLTGKLKVISRTLKLQIKQPNTDSYPQAQTEIYAYIDQLIKELQETGTNHKQAEDLGNLLKRMTSSDPASRPTMEEASHELAKIK